MVFMAGCESLPRDYVLGDEFGAGTAYRDAPSRDSRETPGTVSDAAGDAAVTTPLPEATINPSPASSVMVQGSGNFVRSSKEADRVEAKTGDITLNSENTSLLEVVKVVLGDLLHENYLMSPDVQGTVTLQTSKPLVREDLLPTLELLARMNGAALVYRDGIYHVVLRENAVRGLLSPQLGDTRAPLPQGYGVRIVPLRFISATEMEKILEPFTNTGNIIRVDTNRNLLVLAGTGPEMSDLLATIDIFDVDWLAGMSVALFRPDFVDAQTLAGDLNNVLGDATSGPLAGLLRIIPLERLNGVMVISPRPEYLKKAAEWVARLDQDTGIVGQRLFIYHVQNGKAIDLADVLTQVFQKESTTQAIPPAALAPGLEPVEISTKPPAIAAGDAEAVTATPPPSQPVAERVSGDAQDGLLVSADQGPAIRIIADDVNNALLIMATGQQYRQVEAALKKLDIVPLQVLIEATIAEVALTDELSQGVEWSLNHGIGGRTGAALLDLGVGGVAANVPGFSYAITSTSGVRAVLNVLASESRLNVVSSPSLMVLNNQTASIQAGDQVPITTQQQQSTVATATVVNNIEFRDTGVLLTVTPRVNAGGLVIMEIEQEVSDVTPNPVDPLTPTIQQRKISSTIAVQSGETIVMGGLIRDRKSATSSGIPGLRKLPIVGALFGQENDDQRRTELVVLLTPRAIYSAEEARRITEEFRDKMESLRPIEVSPGAGGSSAVAPTVTTTMKMDHRIDLTDVPGAGKKRTFATPELTMDGRPPLILKLSSELSAGTERA